MLKSILGKHLILLSPDDNTGGDSSTSSDDKGADSSQQQQDDNQSQDDSSGDTDDSSDDSGSTSDDATGDDAGDQSNDQQQDDKQDDASDVVLDKPEDKDLPFNQHARFKELVTEKNTAKQELEAQKPLATQAQALNEFLSTNRISNQEFESALKYLQALKTDPASAFAMLKPTYEQLATLQGDILPPDIHAEVAAGTMTKERGTELAKLRAGQQYQSWNQTQMQQASQQQAIQLIQGTIGTWQQNKQSLEPDLKVGTPLYDLVDKNLKAMPPFKNAQEALIGCEKALTDAKKFIAQFKAAPQQIRRSPTSRNNSSTASAVLKTPEDVMRAIARGVKPNQMKYA